MPEPILQRSITRLSVNLADPTLWQAVADQIGDHRFTYDLSDDSHRMDVVQIVLEATAKVCSRGNDTPASTPRP